MKEIPEFPDEAQIADFESSSSVKKLALRGQLQAGLVRDASLVLIPGLNGLSLLITTNHEGENMTKYLLRATRFEIPESPVDADDLSKEELDQLFEEREGQPISLLVFETDPSTGEKTVVLYSHSNFPLSYALKGINHVANAVIYSSAPNN